MMPKDRREVFLLAAFLKKSHCCQIWKQKLVKVKMVIMNKVKGRMFSAHYQSHMFSSTPSHECVHAAWTVVVLSARLFACQPVFTPYSCIISR